jgi:2-C-methyl-D-erythritol 4-phosphate cytidylyltransferase
LSFVSAVITAAGSGRRFCAGEPKQLVHLNGEPVVSRTVSVFDALDCINEIILVLPGDFIQSFEVKSKKTTRVCGGSNRQQSVYAGLRAANRDADIVLVHDGVRPFASEKIIRAVIDCAAEGYAAVAGIKTTDTIKQTDAENWVQITPERENLWQVQTPQGFPYKILMQAHELAEKEHYIGTDDSMLVERYKLAKAKMVEGDKRNIKITTPDDMLYAKMILNK